MLILIQTFEREISKMAKKKVRKPAKKKVAKKAKTTAKKAGAKKTATKKRVMKMKAKGTAKKAATKKALSPKTTTRNEAMTSIVSKALRAALGQPVPNFEVAATGGQKLTLNGIKGRNIVLYFYPKDATPGCTIEGHEFTKLHEDFKRLNAEVYGVSRDSLESHEKFKTKECYSIDLLSDDKGELCDMFDVIKDKNMYGKMVKGIERSTFIIDQNGNLVKEWRGVKAQGHAQEVLDFLQAQSSR